MHGGSRLLSAALVCALSTLAIGAAPPAASRAPVASAPASLAAPLADATAITPKLAFSSPKIAVKQNVTLKLKGTVSGVGLNSADTLVVRLYRYQGGKWVARGQRTASRKRLTDTSTSWWVSFAPKERGVFKAQALLTSGDGRFKRTFSKPVSYRVVSKKYVALTFDDGAWYNTESIRRSLDKAGVHATFFMLGDATRGYQAQAKRVAKSGHQVAVHSMSHPMLTGLSNSGVRSQLSRCKSLLKRVTGKTATWYRPPGGATNSRVRSVARGLGLREILWTVDTNDWKRPSAATIRARALAAKPGGVVLMHDGGGNRSNTAAAVPGIVKGFKAKGYDMVTMDEWAALR